MKGSNEEWIEYRKVKRETYELKHDLERALAKPPGIERVEAIRRYYHKYPDRTLTATSPIYGWWVIEAHVERVERETV